MRKNQIIEYFIRDRNFNGFNFLIGSGLAFSLMSVCVKAIGGRIPISELVFARATISIIITRFYLYKKKINPWGYQRRLLFNSGLSNEYNGSI